MGGAKVVEWEMDGKRLDWEKLDVGTVKE